MFNNGFKKHLFTFTSLLLITMVIFAQQPSNFWQTSDTLHKKRRNSVYFAEAAFAGTSLIGLYNLWYANYDKSSFHFVNDSENWLQMDKMGHVFSAYALGKTGMDLLAWSGETKKNQILYGATIGFGYLAIIEVFDGFSANWGFSATDVLANATGTGFLIGQQLLWQEQRILLKYSFHQTKYASYRPETLGENTLEQAFKDYNGQTYWLSANLWAFNKKSNWPKWLNLALGYGANGMLYGNKNPEGIIPETSVLHQSTRNFYLSIDVDLSKIKTKSGFLNTLFSTLNYIKIPAPTFEINSKGNTKFHLLFF